MQTKINHLVFVFFLSLMLFSYLQTTIFAAATGVCNITSAHCNTSNITQVPNITTSGAREGKLINIAMAYSPSCPHCEELKSYIESLNSSYFINVFYMNALTNQSEEIKFLNYYEVPKGDWDLVPILFVGKNYCIGDTQCISFLQNNIKNLSESGAQLPATLATGIGSFGIVAITMLALADSVNPCAFAVLILLLSTLFLRNPSKRRDILFAGVAFALGILVFYISVGILLLLGIKSAILVSGISNTYVYAAFGVIITVIGVLNIKDAISYGAGGFVMEVPRRWRPAMVAFIDRIASVPGAFITGIIVTLFLLPCIVGPYFVAGGILSGLSVGAALPWLAYYNIIFILPMLLITLFVYLSFTSADKAHEWRERNVKNLHLIGGILMVLVGLFLIISSALA